MKGAPSLRQVGTLLRLVARGLTSRGGDDLLPEVPRRKPAIERIQPPVEGELHARYLRATDGEGIAGLGDDTLSPVFPATWETAQALELFAGLERPLPAGAVVHVESELVCLRPVPAGEQIRCRVELDRADRVPKGVRLTLLARNWTAAGQLCSQSTAVFLARTRAPEPARAPARESAEPSDAAPPPLQPREWEEVATWELGGEAGRRYAAVSGDWNPIHLWSLTARPFGFRRPILHGFSIEARVAHALIRHRLGGDPAALRRVRISFRAPILLPARVRLLTGETATARWFRVAGDDDEKVFAEGTWAGGSQSRPSLTLVR